MTDSGGAPDQQVCPRCSAAFVCGIAAAQACWCSRLPLLDAALLHHLNQRYVGCLCSNCLVALSNELNEAAKEHPR